MIVCSHSMSNGTIHVAAFLRFFHRKVTFFLPTHPYMHNLRCRPVGTVFHYFVCIQYLVCIVTTRASIYTDIYNQTEDPNVLWTHLLVASFPGYIQCTIIQLVLHVLDYLWAYGQLEFISQSTQNPAAVSSKYQSTKRCPISTRIRSGKSTISLEIMVRPSQNNKMWRLCKYGHKYVTLKSTSASERILLSPLEGGGINMCGGSHLEKPQNKPWPTASKYGHVVIILTSLNEVHIIYRLLTTHSSLTHTQQSIVCLNS